MSGKNSLVNKVPNADIILKWKFSVANEAMMSIAPQRKINE